MRILLIGGYGLTGKHLASLLLEHTDATLRIAGRNLEKGQQYATELNARCAADRASAVALDIADSATLDRTLCDTDLVILATANAEHLEQVARAAIAHEVDYIDILYDQKKWPLLSSLRPEIEAAGCCFITEAGFHPGMLALLVRHAAASFDRIHHVIVSSSIRMRIGRDTPMPESVYGLVEAFSDSDMRYYRGGRWRKPFLWWLLPYRPIRFSHRAGWRMCVPMLFEELRSLPERYERLEHLGFFIAGFNLVVDWIISPTIIVALKLFGKRAIPAMGRLLFWGIKYFTTGPYGTVLQVDARGERGNEPRCLRTVLYHTDEYALTAIPVVALINQYLDGAVRRPGVWMMGHVADPQRLLQDCAAMGVEIHTS